MADSDLLVDAARQAREHAVAPFSGFKVGAALETADGTIVTGCNIENASYGLTMCAERVAIFKAVSDGHRAFRRIAIVADTPAPTAPCGAGNRAPPHVRAAPRAVRCGSALVAASVREHGPVRRQTVTSQLVWRRH